MPSLTPDLLGLAREIAAQANRQYGMIADATAALSGDHDDWPEIQSALSALRRVAPVVEALERLSRNFDLLLAGKPVRDVCETKAEVAAALGAIRALAPGEK